MPDASPVDGKFYEAAPPQSLGERMVIAARDRIYRDFLQHCSPRPGERILDVGVSDVITDGANVLERSYPHQQDIVAVGLGAGGEFRRAYPRAEYIQIEPNKPLPFPDRAFRYATANAVLEHVGSRPDQQRFVAELLRVADEVFITVPNRFFPVEHHTAIPLAHYWDRSFRTACRVLKKGDWARHENLILMSWNGLSRLVPDQVPAALGYTGLKLGPFSSNLFMHVVQPARPANDTRRPESRPPESRPLRTPAHDPLRASG